MSEDLEEIKEELDEARLRAATDEDLIGLHVERKLLQSLHDTQSDHTRRLTKLETAMERVEGRLGVVEGTLKKVHAGVELISDKLDRLIGED